LTHKEFTAIRLFLSGNQSEKRGFTGTVRSDYTDNRTGRQGVQFQFPISSPILESYDTVVALNQPSLDKYEAKIKKGGLMIRESATIHHGPKRTDITSVPVPAYEEATKLGNNLVMGMILLGAFIQKTGVITIEDVIEGIKKTLPARRHHLIPLNETALRRGFEIAAAIK